MMNVNDPSVRRLIADMRGALATYDRDSAGKPDRHAPKCPCRFCDFVRANRELVAVFDDPDSKAGN